MPFHGAAGHGRIWERGICSGKYWCQVSAKAFIFIAFLWRPSSKLDQAGESPLFGPWWSREGEIAVLGLHRDVGMQAKGGIFSAV